MLDKAMDVLEQFPIRKSKKQKQLFRNAVIPFAQQHGYNVTVEKGRRGAQNIVIGNPEDAEFLITAHYDTPASIGIPNIITPCNPVTFIAYQILMVGFFFLAAFVVGLVVSLFTYDSLLIFWGAYIAYFGLLFLMMYGPANRHNANDNTSGVVTVLETMATMPENLRERVCFVLFDLEEAGLVGSASYRKAHKAATNRQTVLNLDCVGDGDHIVLFPYNKMKKDGKRMNLLQKVVSTCGKKTISIREKGFSYYPSDQRHFPYGVGIAAFRRKKGIGLYCTRIHTWRDTILETTNVNILRAAMISLVGAADK